MAPASPTAISLSAASVSLLGQHHLRHHGSCSQPLSALRNAELVHDQQFAAAEFWPKKQQPQPQSFFRPWLHQTSSSNDRRTSNRRRLDPYFVI